MSGQYKSEYTAPIVGSSSCSYNTLGHYYGANSTMAALKPSATKNTYITPAYAAIGYDALTHGNSGGCGSHFNIHNAYPGSDKCQTTYSTRMCSNAGDNGSNGGGNGGGKGLGWTCQRGSGVITPHCTRTGHLGAQGVFGSSYQCQQSCK